MKTAKVITEVDGIHKQWYEDAKKISNAGELSAFVGRLITDYQHDYGTICHALAAAAIAGAYCVEHSPAGGITGFQSGAVFWEFYRHWMQEDGPAKLLKMHDLLYPQMEHKFRSVDPRTWEWVQQEAQKLLNEQGQFPAHPDVMAHWKSIVAGSVPFGLQISSD